MIFGRVDSIDTIQTENGVHTIDAMMRLVTLSCQKLPSTRLNEAVRQLEPMAQPGVSSSL